MKAKLNRTQMFSQRLVSATELIAHLHQLQESKITGTLLLRPDHYQSWTIYFRQGDCLWLSGGDHPQERWQRHLELFIPQVSPTELAKSTCPPSPYRDYLLLGQLYQQGELATQQWEQLLTSIFIEGLFDLIQYTQTNEQGLFCQISYRDIPDLGLNPISTEQLITQGISAWQEWQEAGLTGYSPNLFPVILEPSVLIQYASPQIYQLIRTQVDGTRTLRLLAKKSHQTVLKLTKSLLPLVEVGALSFSSLPSLKKFKLPTELTNPSVTFPSGSQPQSAPLVACVDDSQLVCQTLKTILTPQGYRFLGIQESVKAAMILEKSQPDFIFLDLVMPVLDGYQLCTQLRKIDSLKKVPIVFLTAKDGLLDRMRATLVGANGYLSKPVTVEQVQKMIQKHLSKISPSGSYASLQIG